MQPEPVFHIELFTSTELLAQPWLQDLTRMINDSYLVGHTDKVQFDAAKTRLKTDSRLSEELGSDGFTAVAFENSEVIGTASMKPWKDDGLWKPLDHFATDEVGERMNDKIDQALNENALPGDYELALVALPPGPRFRGRGIAGKLVKVCEEEVLRRRKATQNSGSVGIMIRVVQENVGDYWLKQGFTPVGKQPGPEAWEASMPFTMWAMPVAGFGQPLEAMPFGKGEDIKLYFLKVADTAKGVSSLLRGIRLVARPVRLDSGDSLAE